MQNERFRVIFDRLNDGIVRTETMTATIQDRVRRRRRTRRVAAAGRRVRAARASDLHHGLISSPLTFSDLQKYRELRDRKRRKVLDEMTREAHEQGLAWD